MHRKVVLEDCVNNHGGIKPMDQDLLLISDSKRKRLAVIEMGEGSSGQEFQRIPTDKLSQLTPSCLPKLGGRVDLGNYDNTVQKSPNVQKVGAGFQTQQDS